MALANQGHGGSAGKIPPRPGGRPNNAGGNKTAVPPRPMPKTGGASGSRGSADRPNSRLSARQIEEHRRRRNIYTSLGAAGVVVVVVVVIIAISLTGTTKKPKPSAGSVSGQYDIPASTVSKVEGVPVRTLVAAAAAVPRSSWSASKAGDAVPPQALPAGNKALMDGAKPQILYIASEYCPFCAAQRWAMVMALSKFGTFSGLRGTSSSPTDVFASTPTFTFYNSTFTSKYLSFVAVETETNAGARLQDLTKAQTSLLNKWDAPPYVGSSQQSGSIPFLYMSGKYLMIGSQYDGGALSGMQFTKAADYLTSGSNVTSKGAVAAAGYLVGDICALTHGQPASVCSQVPKSLVGITTSSHSPSKGSETTPSKPAKSS